MGVVIYTPWLPTLLNDEKDKGVRNHIEGPLRNQQIDNFTKTTNDSQRPRSIKIFVHLYVFSVPLCAFSVSSVQPTKVISQRAQKMRKDHRALKLFVLLCAFSVPSVQPTKRGYFTKITKDAQRPL